MLYSKLDDLKIKIRQSHSVAREIYQVMPIQQYIRIVSKVTEISWNIAKH